MIMNIRKIIIILILFAFIFVPFASDTIAKEKKKKAVRTVEIQTKDEMMREFNEKFQDNFNDKKE